jgi:hypothetical protein
MVVQSHVSHERLLQITTIGEIFCFEHISDTPGEALHHAIGSEHAWLGQSSPSQTRSARHRHPARAQANGLTALARKKSSAPPLRPLQTLVQQKIEIERPILDTTVQEQAISDLTDIRLLILPVERWCRRRKELALSSN